MSILIPSLLSGAFAIIGLIVGGILTHNLSLRRERENRVHDAERNRNELLREKREELFLLVDRWIGGFIQMLLPRNLAMTGQISYDQMNDMIIEFGKSGGSSIRNFYKIDMLIAAYAPNCAGAYKECLRLRDEINKFDGPFKDFYINNGPGAVYPLRNSYVNAVQNIEMAGEILKTEIVNEIRNAID